jgi:WD40 repeat protein
VRPYPGQPVFTQDGKRMVLPVGAHLHVIDVDSGKEIHELAVRPHHVGGLAVSPDGRWLLTGTSSQTRGMQLWALASGRRVRHIPLSAGRSHVLAFSSSGKFFATGDYRHGAPIRVYETATGAVVRTLDGFTGSVNDLAFSHDARLLASAFDDTTVLIWDLSQGR